MELPGAVSKDSKQSTAQPQPAQLHDRYAVSEGAGSRAGQVRGAWITPLPWDSPFGFKRILFEAEVACSATF